MQQTSLSMQAEIKNIVFDFGGVLLQIDYRKTSDALSRLLGSDFDFKQLSPQDLHLLEQYETGKTGTETFLWHLQHKSEKNIPDALPLIDAWNAMLIGWKESHFTLLADLRKKYQVYLLSNTNALHLEWVYRDLDITHGIHDFDQRFFTKTYYSHLIGLRKPYAEIYQFVNQDAGLCAEETLFIDDLAPNLVKAAELGWHTYQHNPEDDLPTILRDTFRLLP